MTLFEEHNARRRYPVAYVVKRGEFVGSDQLGTVMNTKAVHEADLIIVVKDGSFYVMKNRTGRYGPIAESDVWQLIDRARNFGW